jgi:hypothetical protein
MTETVIKGSRLKVMLLLAICLIFTAMGVYLLGDPSVSPVMAWLCVGLFGLGVPLSLAMLALPNSVTLRSDHFTVRALWKSYDVAWGDVEVFHVWQNPYARQRLVAWTYRPGCGPTGVMANMSANLGAEGAMPGMMSMSTDKLVALMNQRLAEAR